MIPFKIDKEKMGVIINIKRFLKDMKIIQIKCSVMEC